MGSNVKQNEALTQVINPSSATGGVLKLAEAGSPDSTDPGNTYYAYTWNFERLYARTLVTYNPAPGAAGTQLVPDLATGLGQVSTDGLTWTYHLKPGIKFEDGETVTSKDIKYAVERSANYTTELANGPTYFKNYLTDPNYPGAYNDPTPDKMGLSGITTPDDATIQFHLQQPFADFNYLVTQLETAPVPQAKDTGTNYQNHPLSTGPYKFQSFSQGKSLVLVPNPQWQQSTDTTRKQLNKEIDITFGVDPTDVDSRLINGSIDLDLQSDGLQPDGRSKALTELATEHRRGPGQPVVVHRPGQQGRAAGQRALPPGHRVRGGQGRRPDRLRRPARRWRHRQHGAAADRRRLHQVRRLRGADPAAR